MKKYYCVFTIACLVFLSIGYTCNAQQLPAIKADIEKNNSLYFNLFKNKDMAIVNLYTEDACLMPSNTQAICGKTALGKDFKDTYAGGQVNGVKFATTAVYGNGDLYVTEEGTWQVFGAGDKMIDSGKYLKLWKKTQRGWKIFRDVFNSNQKNQ